MGCLPSCFGSRKNRRRQIRRESFQPRLNRISEESTKENHLNLKVHTFNEVPEVAEGFAKEDHSKVQTVEEESKVSEVIAEDVHLNLIFPCVVEVPIISATPITSNHDKVEEKHSPSPTRKRVTFDSNVKTYEHVVVEESVERVEEEVNPEEKSLKSSQGRCSFEGSGITFTSDSSWSYPSNHRYQNCRESDDEEEDCEESNVEDSDDEDDGGLLDDDYYCDDTYEDKLHNWDKEVYTEEIADNMLDIESIREKTKGSDSSARDRTGYVNAVLNPIENLAQWKAVKSKGRTTNTHTRKENVNLISDQEHKQNASFTLEPQVDELPSFVLKPEPRDETKKQRTQDVAVDASLSSWLSTSQTTTSGRSSVSMNETGKNDNTSRYSKPVQSHDERPILCALTAEEIKQFSATNSPRKSPSRSPESPIIGTVGGYWMATRKYREV